MKAVGTKTYSATASQAKAGQRWYLIDAEGQVLGRVATTVAQLLRGKGKPTFTPHMDGGDYVIVVNADKIVTTGKKETQKIYYRHSNYPGGLTATPLRDMRAKHPTRILEAAVRGMMPKNRLGKKIFLHMKIYAGPDHPHEAQRPVRLEVARNGHKRGQITGESAEALTPPPAATAAPAPPVVAPAAIATTVEPAEAATVAPEPAIATTATSEPVAVVTATPESATTGTTVVTSTDLEDQEEERR